MTGRRPACLIYFVGDSSPMRVASGAPAIIRLLSVTPADTFAEVLMVARGGTEIAAAYVKPASVASVVPSDDLAAELEEARASRRS